MMQQHNSTDVRTRTQSIFEPEQQNFRFRKTIIYQFFFIPIQAFPKDVKVSEDESCTFLYDLFGTHITSKPFKWKSIDEFQPERATAKIFTTPEKLLKFFQGYITRFFQPVCPYLGSMTLLLLECKGQQTSGSSRKYQFQDLLQGQYKRESIFLQLEHRLSFCTNLEVNLEIGIFGQSLTSNTACIQEIARSQS